MSEAARESVNNHTPQETAGVSGGCASRPFPERLFSLGQAGPEELPVDEVDAEELDQRFQESRARRFELLNTARRVCVRSATRKCRRTRVAPAVSVLRGRGGRVRFEGVHTCQSVWSCPVCAAARRAAYGQHITAVTKAREAETGVTSMMLTLTIRHTRRDALGPMLDGLARAWQRVTRGMPWVRFAAKFGGIEWVRVWEVSQGTNGFHPHVHALMFPGRPLLDGERAEMQEWFYARWRAAVDEFLGGKHLPVKKAVDLRHRGRADYIAKMGLELTETAGKTDGKTKPVWELLDRAGQRDSRGQLTRRARAAGALWREWEMGMLGKRLTGWSGGLRDLRQAAQVVVAEERTEERAADTELAQLTPEEWNSAFVSQAYVAHAFERATIREARDYVWQLGATDRARRAKDRWVPLVVPIWVQQGFQVEGVAANDIRI